MRHGRLRSGLCLAKVAALTSCCLLSAALQGLAVAARAPAPAAPPSLPAASGMVQTLAPGTPVEPQASSVKGRLALTGMAMVRMASTVGHKVIVISNTRLDQLFVPKPERLLVLAASRAGVVDGADGGALATGAGGTPVDSTPASPLTPAVVAVGDAPKRDRAADWAAVGLVVVFAGIALSILAPIVRGMGARKDLLPVRAEEYAGGPVLRC